MAGAIRLVSLQRGHDPRDFVLFAFGGAGPLHAVALARELAVMKQEVVHPGRPGESSGCQITTYPGQEAWMKVHKNARLRPYRREELVTRARRGEAMAGLAWQCGISIRTARKWLARYRAEGPSGLQDRSSRPHASPRATAPAIQLGIQVLRHQRWT